MLRTIRQYGIRGSLRLLTSLVKTKLFYSKSRLIRFPFDIRNRHLIDLGIGLTTGYGCRIEAYSTDSSDKKLLIFGSNVQINDYVHISAGEKVTIGDNVLMASKIFISDISHGKYVGEGQDNPKNNPAFRKLYTRPITIERNVWIGESCCILPGVRIGEGSIIGALSVVTHDVPPFSICVGSPAKVIKRFDFNSGKWEKV